MDHIFISYSHIDGEYAHKLAEALQSKGFEVWIDARLDYGSQWPLELQKQLDSCDAFIVIMTPNSFASEWVQNELQRARRKLKPVFPLLLKGDEPWLSVESTQFFDVRGQRLPDARFYSALQRVITPGSQPSGTHVAADADKGKTPLRSTSSKFGVAIAIALIGGIAIVFVAGAVIFAGPLLQKLLNSSPATTSTPDPGIRQTSLPTDRPIAAWTTIPSDVAPTATAEPILVTNHYDVSLCCGDAGTQRSAILDFAIPVETVGVLRIEFSAATDPLACSDIVLHILWDEVEIYSTDRIGPLSGRYTTGSVDLGPFISPGEHTLTLSPEGVLGGCNTGALGGWAGKLIVHTSQYP